jgi:hypothetical protein
MRSILSVCAIVLFSSQIQAAPSATTDWKTKAPASETDRPELTLDVRLLGGPLGTFIDEPSEADKLTTLPKPTSLQPYQTVSNLGFRILGLGGWATAWVSRWD